MMTLGREMEARHCDSEIFDKITEIVEENGSISQKTKDQLILMGINELHRCLDTLSESSNEYHREHRERHLKIDEDIKELRRNSLMLWIRKNKILAGIIAILVLVASDIFKGILLLLGVPNTIIP